MREKENGASAGKMQESTVVFGGGVKRRALAAVSAAFFLLALIVPVIAGAESPGEEASGVGPTLVQEGIMSLPAGEELTEAFATAEGEEVAHAEWLEGEEATQQRQTSRTAYTELTGSEAAVLLANSFAPQLQQLEADPARALSEVEIEKPLGEYGALVAAEGGGSAILESPVPVESEVGEETSAPVSLELEEVNGGFAPENPLSEVQLPGAADGSIQLQSGVAVDLPGSGSQEAEMLGTKSLFYAETQETTDTLAAPVSRGVEVYEQLRSPESPEQFQFDLKLPEGASLQASAGGGAEVVSASGHQLEEIPPASAVDAQGSLVPVTSAVEGDSLLITVAHRSGDFAYPILLDPRYNEGYESPPFSGWAPVKNYSEYSMSQDPSHLAAISEGSFVNYPANTWGQWEYTPPGQTAYIEQATFSNIYYIPHSCQTAQPHGYVGIFNVFSNSYNKLWTFSGGESFSPGFGTGYVGGAGTRKAIVGIGTGGSSSSLSCAHEIYVGGVTVQENDPEAPTINSVSGIPGGWFDPAKAGSATIVTTDPGFGVTLVAIFNEGGITSEDHVGCTGMANSRCPGQVNWTIAPPYKQGERTLKVTSEDPTGKVATWSTTTKMDATRPEVELTNQLAHVTEEEGTKGSPEQKASESQLSLPVYNLSIKATDGSEASKTEKQSGVKNIEIYLDGAKQNVPWSEQSCPASSCKMEKTYQLKLVGKEAGEHKLVVKAVDQVGLVREREILFEYIPATGIKDEYVMQRFPLSSGGPEEGGSDPELAVNVINGNLVYHQQDVNVAGPNVDLEVERIYNSQLPKPASSEWGSGWTLAQTPELEPEEGGEAPKKAALLDNRGVVARAVALPTESGGEKFNSRLHALVTKQAGGGYTIADHSGETEDTLVFDSSGKVTEERTPGPATLDYSYQSGKLSKIAVDDPSTAGAPIMAAAEEEDEDHLATPSYRSSFGITGSGNGQFKHPADLALDSQGNLWVVDKENNRIEKFNEAGSFLTAVGSKGGAAGQLSAPSAVAVDPSGNLWVADTSNNRIVEFNQAGQFVLTVGREVNKTKVEAGANSLEKGICTAASGNVCQAGLAGPSEFFMNGPKGITATSGGNIWVADTGNNRLKKFSPTGSLINNIGGEGSEAGKVKEPTAITMGPDGSIWVADSGNNRIEQWNSSLAFVRAVGKEGTGNGEFKHPDAIDSDIEGNIYVADQGNGRIQQLSPTGQFLSRFGSSGSGATQFSLSDPAGLAVDGKGNIWLTDPGNDRVERWIAPYGPVYASQFGATGSGNGQFKHPADVALDSQGNLWVVDKENNRIEKFNEAGQFLLATGGSGSAGGKLSSPSAIAIDSAGNVDVTDTANNRVAQFSSTGAFVEVIGANVNKTKVEAGGTALEKNRCTAASGNVCQAGTAGSGEGQIAGPIGITTTGGQNMFVVERPNNRVEKFSPQAELLAKFGELGAGNGQLKEPTSIAFNGNLLWVADTGNNRAEAFTTSYVYSRKFGQEGTGNGEFKHPDAIETDPEGNVYVADQGNGRVQEFTSSGEFLSRLGSSGTGVGQLSLSDPEGLALDAKSNIWIADGGNNRIQRWQARSTAPLPDAPPAQPEPTVAVQTSGGLVSTVEGEAAGKYTYQHTGERLTAVAGPAGETKYQYDGIGRLTKVELPNGNWATIAYRDDMRVESVTVSLGGVTKKTSFSYTDQPRETVVTPEEELATHYSIGEDGSILKWWNGNTLPEFEPMEGSLWVQRGEVHPEPITIGDQNLLVRAHSSEGIKSIRIVANGTQIVSEKSCEEAMCVNLQKELVTNTANWPPGILQLETIVTGRLQQVVTQRFWDNIPYTPPPDPEAEEPPTFEEVQRFREEFGLDLDLKENEQAINERIFTLIGDWHDPSTPAGQVARSSAERWGVPLRAVDVAEMEFRESYIAQAAAAIPHWSEAHAASTYAGYYVDQRQGGIIHVGFTSEQSIRVGELKSQGGLLAPGRVEPFQTTPTASAQKLGSIMNELPAKVQAQSGIINVLARAGVNSKANTVEIFATNVATAQAFVQQAFGAGSPINVNAVASKPVLRQLPRSRPKDQRLFGGDWIENPSFYCSIGFGASEQLATKVNNETVYAHFALTAGHCFGLGDAVSRVIRKPGGDEAVELGKVRRRIYEENTSGVFESDGEAVRLEAGVETPTKVYLSSKRAPIPVKGVESFAVGSTLCTSGTFSGYHCGVATEPFLAFPGEFMTYVVETTSITTEGDSGGSVWDAYTGMAVGLVEGGYEATGPTWMTPLLPVPLPNGAGTAPGLLEELDAPGGGSFNIARAK